MVQMALVMPRGKCIAGRVYVMWMGELYPIREYIATTSRLG